MKIKTDELTKMKNHDSTLFEWFYVVNIAHVDGVVSCELSEYAHYSIPDVVKLRFVKGEFVETQNISFDLYTVLGDFVYASDDNKHPFFLNYDVDNRHPSDDDWNNGYRYPVKPKYLWHGHLNNDTLPREVDKFLHNDKYMSFDVFDKARVAFQLKLQYTPYHNPKKEREIKQQANWDYIDYPNTPRIWTVGEAGTFNPDWTLDDLMIENGNNNYRYEYKCHSIADIVFSVLHYLIAHKYKFHKCKHCGGYFATQTFKQEYCNRKSPYKGQGHNKCEQAVRDIRQDLRRKYIRTYNRVYPWFDRRTDFLLSCGDKRDISKLFSVSDFKLYEDTLKPHLIDRRRKNAQQN